MERAVLHRTNDSFRATNPADEFLGPEPEDELPEPTVEEVWGANGRGEYVTEVTFASGNKYIIVLATGGAMVGDYEVHGHRFDDFGLIANGFLSPEEAINWLCDPERRDW
jgi:hypothetical protein